LNGNRYKPKLHSVFSVIMAGVVFSVGSGFFWRFSEYGFQGIPSFFVSFQPLYCILPGAIVALIVYFALRSELIRVVTIQCQKRQDCQDLIDRYKKVREATFGGAVGVTVLSLLLGMLFALALSSDFFRSFTGYNAERLMYGFDSGTKTLLRLFYSVIAAVFIVRYILKMRAYQLVTNVKNVMWNKK